MERDSSTSTFKGPDEIPEFLKGRFKFIPPKDGSSLAQSPEQSHQQNNQQNYQNNQQHNQRYQQHKQNFHRPHSREPFNKFQRTDKRNINVHYNNNTNKNNTNYSDSNSSFQSFNKNNHSSYRLPPSREHSNNENKKNPLSNNTAAEEVFVGKDFEEADEENKSKPISLFR